MKFLSPRHIAFFTLFGLFIHHTASAFNHHGALCKQNQHAFGLLATDPLLDEIEKDLPPEPPLSHTGKSLVTFNKQGFDVVDAATAQDSFLIQSISDFSKHATHPILEIGGGYGRLSQIMLAQGATVIENDLDMRHLIYGRKLIAPELRDHLYLNAHRFPRAVILKPNSLSGVVLHRVIHLMTPDEIEEGFAKINKWLVPGGKIFIAVLPPQHIKYRDKVLATYEQRWQQGQAWPGAGFNSKMLLPEQAYALPKTLHVMDERPLKLALEKYGFKVEKYGFIPMKKFHGTKEDAGKELFGLVAVKHPL
ncbi:MAG: class I SAM-dependent methyltransferase [Proteobacteria bacterium]|nr:class I SAM-dependent methyltransferase [Pseudomonadota bacterium]